MSSVNPSTPRPAPEFVRRDLCILLLILLLFPSPLRAGAGEHSFSVTSRYAQLRTVTDDKRNAQSSHGVVLGGRYQYSFADAFSLRTTLSLGPTFDNTGTTWTGVGTLGLAYTFDVIRYVPSFHVALGALAFHVGDFNATIRPIIEVGAALDTLKSRTFSWGLGFAAYFLNNVTYVSAGPHLTWRWGYF